MWVATISHQELTRGWMDFGVFEGDNVGGRSVSLVGLVNKTHLPRVAHRAPLVEATPCIERKFGVQIKISRTLFGFRENPCRFGVFSEGLFFALIFS